MRMCVVCQFVWCVSVCVCMYWCMYVGVHEVCVCMCVVCQFV